MGVLVHTDSLNGTGMNGCVAPTLNGTGITFSWGCVKIGILSPLERVSRPPSLLLALCSMVGRATEKRTQLTAFNGIKWILLINIILNRGRVH